MALLAFFWVVVAGALPVAAEEAFAVAGLGAAAPAAAAGEVVAVAEGRLVGAVDDEGGIGEEFRLHRPRLPP